MRIFSKKPKVKSTISVDGIVVSLDPKFDMWEFTYRDNDFFTYESDLHMPSRRERGFGVAWSDGATWGDMEVIFWVKDHQITDESWGD